MIRSRSYAVPLVGVLLALATGVALGAGPLTTTRSSAQPAPTVATPAPQARYPDTFAASVASQLYAGGLSRRPVALVTMPGADPATVAALTTQVRAAGARLTGHFTVGAQLVDPEQKNLVDTLGAQLRIQLHGQVDKAATTYPRVGQLLAVAVANRGTAEGRAGDDVAAVRQSLAAAHLLGVPRGGPTTAPLVLVVLGTGLDQTIADGVVAGLAAGARGVVAVAPTQDPNLLGLHADGVTRQVTAVDGSETNAGRIAAVLGLIRAWQTRGGSYGASGSDGPVPLG